MEELEELEKMREKAKKATKRATIFSMIALCFSIFALGFNIGNLCGRLIQKNKDAKEQTAYIEVYYAD